MWLRRLILYAGEEPQPHLHLAVQTDTFTWNLCTIRIEIGAVPSYCSGTTQEPSPSLSLLILHHNISKEIPWNICIFDISPGGFSRALEPHCKFCWKFCHPFHDNLPNPPHPAGNRRANRRNLLNWATYLFNVVFLESLSNLGQPSTSVNLVQS